MRVFAERRIRVRLIFNIGSDDVKSFRDIYQYVIDRAATRRQRLRRCRRMPHLPSPMRIAHQPWDFALGPYHTIK